MPIYRRKNVAWTPPSLMNESFALEDSDFIQDPDQTKDILPQPYRLIDKILFSIVDDVWDQISNREADRIFDASRFRPPQYECAVHVEADGSAPLGQAECMVATPDGRYVIVGLPTGLLVILAETQQVVAAFSEDNLHVCQVQVVLFGTDAYLVSTVDDMGCARLYGLTGDQIYHLTTINEGDSGTKTVATKCEASSEGDFLGVALEKPSAQEQWLEIHRLPKENWLKDLEGLLAKAQKDSSQMTLQSAKAPTPTVEDVGAPLDSGRSAEGIVESVTAADTSPSTDRLMANTSAEDARSPRRQRRKAHHLNRGYTSSDDSSIDIEPPYCTAASTTTVGILRKTQPIKPRKAKKKKVPTATLR